jgi:hypothetical protein
MHVTECINDSAEGDLAHTLEFYQNLSDEVDKIVSDKISSREAFKKFPRQISERCVVGPLLGDKKGRCE